MIQPIPLYSLQKQEINIPIRLLKFFIQQKQQKLFQIMIQWFISWNE